MFTNFLETHVCWESEYVLVGSRRVYTLSYKNSCSSLKAGCLTLVFKTKFTTAKDMVAFGIYIFLHVVAATIFTQIKDTLHKEMHRTRLRLKHTESMKPLAESGATHSDVVLVSAEGAELHAHKAILGAHSKATSSSFFSIYIFDFIFEYMQ